MRCTERQVVRRVASQRATTAIKGFFRIMSQRSTYKTSSRTADRRSTYLFYEIRGSSLARNARAGRYRCQGCIAVKLRLRRRDLR